MAFPKKFSVISNSSPLIILSKIERIDLLFQLYGRITVPKAVYLEVVVEAFGRPGSHVIQKYCDDKLK